MKRWSSFSCVDEERVLRWWVHPAFYSLHTPFIEAFFLFGPLLIPSRSIVVYGTRSMRWLMGARCRRSNTDHPINAHPGPRRTTIVQPDGVAPTLDDIFLNAGEALADFFPRPASIVTIYLRLCVATRSAANLARPNWRFISLPTLELDSDLVLCRQLGGGLRWTRSSSILLGNSWLLSLEGANC